MTYELPQGSGPVIHALAGFLTALSVKVNPVLAVLCLLTFLIYEMDQDWRKDDWLDEEFCEYGFGLFLATAILIIMTLM